MVVGGAQGGAHPTFYIRDRHRFRHNDLHWR